MSFRVFKKIHIVILSQFLAILFPVVMFADSDLQELHINFKGEAHFVGAKAVRKHALNLLSVEIWGQKWLITTGSDTEFVTASGSKLNEEEIAVGHTLEIKGWPVKGNLGYIEAKFIRDTSIPGESIVPSQAAVAASTMVEVKTQPAPVQLSPPVVPSSLLPPLAPVASPPFSGESRITGNLYLGMRGGEVVVLQKFLQKNGWGIPDDGPVTGFFGKVTENALKKFQEASGLEQTGTTGPKTRVLISAALGKSSTATKMPSAALPPPPPSFIQPRKVLGRELTLGAKGKEVAVLQEFLQKNNWGIPDDGPVTGFFGKVTEKAVMNFQKAKGLAALGTVDFKTRELINLLLNQY